MKGQLTRNTNVQLPNKASHSIVGHCTGVDPCIFKLNVNDHDLEIEGSILIVKVSASAIEIARRCIFDRFGPLLMPLSTNSTIELHKLYASNN